MLNNFKYTKFSNLPETSGVFSKYFSNSYSKINSSVQPKDDSNMADDDLSNNYSISLLIKRRKL